MPNKHLGLWIGCLAASLLAASCATAPQGEAKRSELIRRAASTVERFMEVDPSINKKFFTSAHGVAVFPTVGKGGIGIGGAYGRGVLYEGSKVVGFCDLSQGTIGFQLGGQAYSQIIFFETSRTLENFKQGSFDFDAQVSAVAAAADASANADYDHGVAVFTLAAKGLMYEASVGGQKFSFEPR